MSLPEEEHLDEHGECAAEIARLTTELTAAQAELAALRKDDDDFKRTAFKVIRGFLKAFECENAPTDDEWVEIRKVAAEYSSMLDASKASADRRL